MMKTVVVIQARTGSSRLPNKVMMPLAGRPLLERMIARVQAARHPDAIVVATTTEAADEPIRDLAAALGVACYSGSRDDLLDRHYHAARLHDADVVVKIPSDCPMIDPTAIDRVIGHYLAFPDAYDYVGNLHPASWPDGNDVEVMPMRALEIAWRSARRPLEREHTTPFLWENTDRFRIGSVRWERNVDYSMTHRWTIDYPEDYAFIAAVYDALVPRLGPVFGADAVLDLLRERPELAAINAHLAGVNWYRHHLDELRTVDGSMTRTMEGNK